MFSSRGGFAGFGQGPAKKQKLADPEEEKRWHELVQELEAATLADVDSRLRTIAKESDSSRLAGETLRNLVLKLLLVRLVAQNQLSVRLVLFFRVSSPSCCGVKLFYSYLG